MHAHDTVFFVAQKIVEEQNLSFGEDFVNEKDPSILQFLLASGEEVSYIAGLV